MGCKVAIFLLSTLFLGAKVFSCPPSEDLAPYCTCKDFSNDSVMSCMNILCPDDLIAPIKAISKHKSRIFSLSIYNSSLLYLPDGIFKETFIKQIRFMSTEIMAFSESDVAFEGLEETLSELRAINAEYVAEWDWQQLINLRRLSVIDVDSMTIESIDYPLPFLPALTALGIIQAKVSFIADSAFSNLPNLTIFNMMQNDISEVKRNMLPDPAHKLAIIDLSLNDLAHLPEDFFSNMPKLTDVNLDYNKFTTLNEKPFSQAFGFLSKFTMIDNPFRCDCRLRWIAERRLPFIFKAYCSTPTQLRNTSLKDLELKLLWC